MGKDKAMQRKKKLCHPYKEWDLQCEDKNIISCNQSIGTKKLQ